MSPVKARFSREEFYDLMVSQLARLEQEQEARHRYGQVLAALRYHLEAYQVTSLPPKKR